MLIDELTSESLMPGFGVNFSSSSLISSANMMCSFLILSARFDRYLKKELVQLWNFKETKHTEYIIEIKM